LPGLPPSSTGARAEQPCNPLTPAAYRPGFFLAIDNNQGKEKAMKTHLEELLAAGQDIIGQLEDAKESPGIPSMRLRSVLESAASCGDQRLPIRVSFLAPVASRASLGIHAVLCCQEIRQPK
jgi:hypothetical protein